MSKMPEHWISVGLIGASGTFQRAAREYAEEYAEHYAQSLQRKPLTDEELASATGARRDVTSWIVIEAVARAVERAHGIGA